TAERNEIVRARLRALVADDAGLRAGGRLHLQPQDAAESRCGWPPLRRVLEREGGLRCVLESEPQPFQQVDEADRLEEPDDRLHGYALSPMTIVGSVSPDMMIRSLRSTVPSLRILSCRRIRPYKSASGRGGQPETYTSTGTTLSTP